MGSALTWAWTPPTGSHPRRGRPQRPVTGGRWRRPAGTERISSLDFFEAPIVNAGTRRRDPPNICLLRVSLIQYPRHHSSLCHVVLKRVALLGSVEILLGDKLGGPAPFQASVSTALPAKTSWRHKRLPRSDATSEGRGRKVADPPAHRHIFSSLSSPTNTTAHLPWSRSLLVVSGVSQEGVAQHRSVMVWPSVWERLDVLFCQLLQKNHVSPANDRPNRPPPVCRATPVMVSTTTSSSSRSSSGKTATDRKYRGCRSGSLPLWGPPGLQLHPSLPEFPVPVSSARRGGPKP